MKTALALVLAGLFVAACGSSAANSTTTTTQAPVTTTTTARPVTTTTACALSSNPTYIQRSDDVGAGPAIATEVGAADLANCTSILATFQQDNGQTDGCVTIALASSNPDYDVNSTGPAPPLKDVIEEAGKTCAPKLPAPKPPAPAFEGHTTDPVRSPGRVSMGSQSLSQPLDTPGRHPSPILQPPRS